MFLGFIASEIVNFILIVFFFSHFCAASIYSPIEALAKH